MFRALKLWAFRQVIFETVRAGRTEEIIVEIEQARSKIHYEDNRYDAQIYYRDVNFKANNLLAEIQHQKMLDFIDQ